MTWVAGAGGKLFGKPFGIKSGHHGRRCLGRKRGCGASKEGEKVRKEQEGRICGTNERDGGQRRQECGHHWPSAQLLAQRQRRFRLLRGWYPLDPMRHRAREPGECA